METCKQKIYIKSIKELMLAGHSIEELRFVCDELYDMTNFICEDYPKHKNWFYQKHLPAVFDENSGRDIVFACDKMGYMLELHL